MAPSRVDGFKSLCACFCMPVYAWLELTVGQDLQ